MRRAEAEITSDLSNWPTCPEGFAALGAQHLAPIAYAVRHYDCRLAVIRQRCGRFSFAGGSPIIGIVGDDTTCSLGPSAFSRRSLARFLSSCDAAVIVSSGAEVAPYVAALASPMLRRRNAIIIETRPRHEADWIAMVLAERPDIQLLISKPGGLH